MRASQAFVTTLKESPKEAELTSHQLMIRSGMIRKNAAGIYTWLPLGFRVLQKVTAIVRQEMDAVGGLEMFMPAIQPKELWLETERWDKFGPQLLKITDRHDREFCFGPTHEEIITDLMRTELKSYKQLPMTCYQIQSKFRDEIRPRFGVMRAREFMMKDAYSFHIDKASLASTYDDMYGAYSKIFSRCGLTFRAVTADTGAIGGDGSHEFHVLADSGEDAIAYCEQSDYCANVECTPTVPTEAAKAPSEEKSLVTTPNIHSVSEQAAFMQLDTKQILKTLLVKGETSPAVALLLRGDHELNPIKAEKHPLIASPLTLVEAATFTEIAKCKPGFIGPIDLSVPIIADLAVAGMHDFSCGANQTDHHFKGVNWERDLPLPDLFDLRQAMQGDLSPDGQGTLSICRGIEVGHIFQLGDTYSQAMQATVLDNNGKSQALSMGCYGIGVSRIVAAAIEQHHDDQGICWPMALAPYQVVLITIQYHKSALVKETADALYNKLQSQGIEVMLDDRNERPGAKFADWDLIGIPLRVTLGEKSLAKDEIGIKARTAEAEDIIALKDIEHTITQLLSAK